MGKGAGQWVWQPAFEKTGKGSGKGKGKGKGKKKRTDSHEDEDPPGSCRVLVIGFDFGTTDEQFEGHMSQAGTIHKVHWINGGKAVVVYEEADAAVQAAALDKSTIDGNTRYITVITGDKDK